MQHDEGVTTTAEQRLAAAQLRLRQLTGSDSATWAAVLDELRAAEREVASERGESYAVPVEDGPRWDTGAPLPHLLATGSSTYIVCHASEPHPGWDGTSVTVVSAADDNDSPLLVIEAKRCAEVRLGGPNDEALNGHPLYGKGLVGYQLNEVRNSDWIEQVIRVNSVHPLHRDEPYRRLRHFVLPFHDEMVEVLAHSIETTKVTGTLRGVLTGLVEQVTT